MNESTPYFSHPTPPPWGIRKHPKNDVLEVYESSKSVNPKFQLAPIAILQPYGGDEERALNAALICGAHDLLRELKVLVKLLHESGADVPELKAARAAIKKAESPIFVINNAGGGK